MNIADLFKAIYNTLICKGRLKIYVCYIAIVWEFRTKKYKIKECNIKRHYDTKYKEN